MNILFISDDIMGNIGKLSNKHSCTDNNLYRSCTTSSVLLSLAQSKTVLLINFRLLSLKQQISWDSECIMFNHKTGLFV